MKIRLKSGEIVETYEKTHSCKKMVRVRKEHKCCLCGRIIRKGETALMHKYHDDPYAGNRGYVCWYYCNDCFEIVEDET
mgnify:CR=1 FL=1